MKSYNESLLPLPTDKAFIDAVREITQDKPAHKGASAREVAYKLRVEAPRRLGTRASKGNWSGTMPEAVRTAPRLAALARKGKLVRRTDSSNYGKWIYRVEEDEDA